MKGLIFRVSVLLLGLAICTSSFAADDSEDKTFIRLTPRIWFSFANTIDDDDSSTEMFFLPMYGATLSVTPKGAPNYNFLLTGLYGEGEGDFQTAFDPPGETEAERMDVELLVRYNFPGKNFAIFAGPRFVDFDEKDTAGSFYANTETTVTLAEIGIGNVINITDDGRHRFFGNFTFGVAFANEDYSDSTGLTASYSGTYPAIDFNFGYQYSIGLSSSFSLRYRGFIIFDENDYEQTKLNTFHGPELAFTINF